MLNATCAWITYFLRIFFVHALLANVTHNPSERRYMNLAQIIYFLYKSLNCYSDCYTTMKVCTLLVIEMCVV